MYKLKTYHSQVQILFTVHFLVLASDWEIFVTLIILRGKTKDILTWSSVAFLAKVLLTLPCKNRVNSPCPGFIATSVFHPTAWWYHLQQRGTVQSTSDGQMGQPLKLPKLGQKGKWSITYAISELVSKTNSWETCMSNQKCAVNHYI